MRIYSVEYSTADTVPTLKGRYGTDSQGGRGIEGVFVS